MGKHILICNSICIKDASTCVINVFPCLWYLQSMFYVCPRLPNVTKTLHSGHCDALPRFPLQNWKVYSLSCRLYSALPQLKRLTPPEVMSLSRGRMVDTSMLVLKAHPLHPAEAIPNGHGNSKPPVGLAGVLVKTALQSNPAFILSLPLLAIRKSTPQYNCSLISISSSASQGAQNCGTLSCKECSK